MTNGDNCEERPYLRIHEDKSVFVNEDGISDVYIEGQSSAAAQERALAIQRTLEDGYLRNLIEECRNANIDLGDISDEAKNLLESLVNAVTSEVGRAVVGLTVMQLCIKSICPEQSIRLHKGSSRRGSFSWQDGISMRTIDRNYITPLLREYELSLHNRDGVMMTRTLAENYPYTQLFKAEIRGAKSEWLKIVDIVESNQLNPLNGLRNLLVLLHNRSEALSRKANAAMVAVNNLLSFSLTADDVKRFIKHVVDTSAYSARLFEISLHSLYQVLEDRRVLPGFLKRMSQMRSANKKHGDIGDVQIVRSLSGLDIIESWDAKYGKPYLRDELEELNEKLGLHPEVEVAGFVVDKDPDIRTDIEARKEEIASIHGISLDIFDFNAWVDDQLTRVPDDTDSLCREWIIAFSESICQKRRERAPIDEPCDGWIDELHQAAIVEYERLSR